MEISTISLIFLLGIIIGGVIIYFYIKVKTVSRNTYESLNNLYIKANSDKENLNIRFIEIEKERNEQKKHLETLEHEKKTLEIDISNKNIECENLNQKNKEQKEEVEQLQEKFTKEFENLANKILEEKSSKFTSQNKENLQNILSPLQEKIQLFEKKIEVSQKENISIHSSLKEQLYNLQTQNIKITQEAENLTKALKGDSKTQGIWGELVLEKVLEKSGLEKDREYFVQQSFEDPNNIGRKIRPDVVINLSNDKKIIIDSKVSLTHYEKFVNEEDPSQKEYHIKEHLRSVKNHIEDLSKKKYHEIYNMKGLEFVLLFVPNDHAFAYALNCDHTIWERAFERNIIIVTPITILAALKTINSLWDIQKRQENAEEIARLAGSVYDKIVGYVENLEKVGKKLDEAKTEYSNAKTKLSGRGSALVSIEKLRKMGAKTQKSLPKNLIEDLENTKSIKLLKE